MNLFEKVFRKLFSRPYHNVGIRELLQQKFDAYGIWYPLRGDIKPNDVEYFDIDVFAEKFGKLKTIALLRNMGVLEISEINEIGDDQIIGIEELEFTNNETFYCNINVDWVIYCSHERTITFGGKILLDLLKIEWKGWDQYIDSLDNK